MGLVTDLLNTLEKLLDSFGVHEADPTTPAAPSQPEQPINTDTITITPEPTANEPEINIPIVTDPPLSIVDPIATQPETQPNIIALEKPSYIEPKKYPTLSATDPTAPTQTKIPTIDERTVYKETYREYYEIRVYDHLKRDLTKDGLFAGIARPIKQPYSKYTLPSTGISQAKRTIDEALTATRAAVDAILHTAETVEANAGAHPNPLY